MEFDSEWVTLGNHRVRLRGVRSFPTEKLHCMAEVAKIAVESNLSAAARLLDVTSEGGKAYTISIGTTFPKDRDAAPHLEIAMATVFGIKPEQVRFDVTVVSQTEVDLHFGVYERMLAEKLGIVPPIQ